MKTNIKGNWISYNYAVNITNKELVEKLLKEEGYNVTYLGKSKVYMDSNGDIFHLKNRSTFWIINRP